MVKPCLSLIVLLGSSSCSPIKYLGVPGYSQEVISRTIYPVRTALDVLQPSVGYGYGSGYGYGYPWALNSFGLAQPSYPSVLTGLPSLPTFQVVAPVAESVAVAKDVVEVSVEETEEDDTPTVVTIKENIDALPTPALSPFKDLLQGPPIPAGIVQATQPKFTQVLFKNPKFSPHHHSIAPEVLIQHNIQALPQFPHSHVSNSKFRSPIAPPIPAGIAQATQPIFERVHIRLH